MPKLNNFRKQIDDIDDKIIEQIMARIAVVKKVGEHKQTIDTHPCPIRPAREAIMLRAICERFAKADFPAIAASAIWRIIIGASTSIEADMTLSVFAHGKDNDLFWLAREYFGTSAPIIKQPHEKRVISDVVEGKAAVGIVPILKGGDGNDWWVSLLQQGENAPKIFAHIPFVYTTDSDKNFPSALALAKLEPEPSGDDVSIVVVEASSDVSQSRLQTAFMAEKLQVNWLNIANLINGSRHHLLEIKGFIDKEHKEFSSVLKSLGECVIKVHYLGAYATPITLENKKK